jgi:hypothetical protein
MNTMKIHTATSFYKYALSLLLLVNSFHVGTAQELMTLDESCLAVGKEIYSAEDNSKLLCQTPSGRFYIIPSVDPVWIKQKMITGELFSGETLLDIPLNTIVDRATETLQLVDPPKLMFSDDSDRRLRSLAKATGTKTILAVRIMASNSGMSINEQSLSDSIFGGWGDQVNLRSQYMACSHGKLEFVKRPDLDGPSAKIRNGVVTISVSLPKEAGHSRMVNAVSDKLRSQFGLTVGAIADHVMYCLPKGTFDGVGYAVMNRGLSVYNDDLCTSVSSQMHEIGHNLNLGHSSQGTEKYGDQSGMMGYSYRDSESPNMCFNAAKGWQLGWYEDKTVSFSPGSSGGYEQTFSIGSIVDYDNSDNTVIIEIQQPTLNLNNYYVAFNAAKGFNSGVREGADQVLVFEKPLIDGNDSWRQADLSAGNEYTISNFDGNVGDFLKITVLGINYATSVAEIFIKLHRVRTAEPSPSPTRDMNGRNPTPTTPTGTAQSCHGSFGDCISDNDCCSGFTCRRVSDTDTDIDFSFGCRATAKQSKDKLARTSTLTWGNRRLRGDASAGRQPDDLLLEDSA